MAIDTIAERIATARKSLGITQEDVVEKISKRIAMYRLWERGKRVPGDGDLIQLSEALQVNFDWLKSNDGPMRGGGEVEMIDLDLAPGGYKKELIPVRDDDGNLDYYIKATYQRLTIAEGEEEKRKDGVK